ncbi:hypothetical protein WMF31_24485 [Sorangium sp. So ce1036]|uniref:hypothetical protein n=1 Tax=Sorangium sp. So ce1036 TaxID=3133328 RepID=UPI003F0CDA98
MRAISRGQTCAAALAEAQKKPGFDQHGPHFTAGLVDVHGAFTAPPRCGTDPVGELAQGAAKEELRDWEHRKRMSGATR